MVKKDYSWREGAELGEHSRRKHKILREYFFDYLTVRCQLPQQTKFRLAIIDGFAGGGRYRCGTAGSPIIFIEVLRQAIEIINIDRVTKGLNEFSIQCLLIFNDSKRDAIETLKKNVEPLLAEIKENIPNLHLDVQYMNGAFETVYPEIKRALEQGRYRSVLFNLDQCGYSQVRISTLTNIMRSYRSVEIFFTFVVDGLLKYFPKNDLEQQKKLLAFLEVNEEELQPSKERVTNKEWLGKLEKLAFYTFQECAPYVSPFCINNPDGYLYWLMHFANSYRARQVYNNKLHDNANYQAHFGRSGLDMLSYNPHDDKGFLYVFDDNGRKASKDALHNDIPRFVTEAGDAIRVLEFYESVYNKTPAHADDMHNVMIENEDIEIITPDGGTRRVANTIDVKDVIKLKTQRSFFPIFFESKTK